MPTSDYYKRQADQRPEALVEIDYTNHRGERAKRTILPLWPQYMQNEWHTTRQWLLIAYCLKSRDIRTFAMQHIHGWKPANADHPSQTDNPGPNPTG